ncbi:MAG: phosphatase PAP2 family protein [Flavobacteriales bacterium]|nr:phosphatase PAP2 family protein [Flavobacteriales bacterium]
MLKLKLFLLVVLFLGCLKQAAAQVDSISANENKPKKSILTKSIFPTTLIITGFALNRSSFEKDVAKNVRNQVGNDFNFPIDDYIQYIPMLEMYGADLMGLKAKNHWFDQTKYLAISQLTTAIFVHSIKRGMNKQRPDNSPHAFPSGHTSQVFVGATVLYHEFKDEHPVLAYSGFAIATTTGAFRIINNRHWLSDVVSAAGIGFLVTNVVYHFEPFKNFNPFNKSKNTSFLPYYNGNEFGLYLTTTF